MRIPDEGLSKGSFVICQRFRPKASPLLHYGYPRKAKKQMFNEDVNRLCLNLRLRAAAQKLRLMNQ